jgi:hypothetical protein
MRYAAAEKLEIIRLVEQSSSSVRRTLAQLGIPRSTFYCCYDRYRSHDAGGLEDRTPGRGGCGTNSHCGYASGARSRAQGVGAIAAGVGGFVRRSAGLLVSEASVYRLLKDDLITSPAFILMKAADTFAHPNQRTQSALANPLYLPACDRLGAGSNLSTVLDDFSRYILAWKLKHLSEVAETNDTAAPVSPTFTDLYRFPWRRKESRGNRPFPRSTSGTESSNLSRSASESCLCGFSAGSGEIARACGFICVIRGTGENHFPPFSRLL